MFTIYSIDPSFIPRNTFLQKPNKIEFIKTPIVEQKTCQTIVNNVNQLVKEQIEGRLFAVIQVMGKQYKVTAGDILVFEGYWAPTIGDKLRMEKVWLTQLLDGELIYDKNKDFDIIVYIFHNFYNAHRFYLLVVIISQ